MNVFAPREAKDLPVLVFFYGGGFVEGSSYEMGLYDGHHVSVRHQVGHTCCDGVHRSHGSSDVQGNGPPLNQGTPSEGTAQFSVIHQKQRSLNILLSILLFP